MMEVWLVVYRATRPLCDIHLCLPSTGHAKLGSHSNRYDVSTAAMTFDPRVCFTAVLFALLDLQDDVVEA